jgi:hypothetical protein
MTARALLARERATFKLIHVVGLDPQEAEEFARETGPNVKAAVTAVRRTGSFRRLLAHQQRRSGCAISIRELQLVVGTSRIWPLQSH